MWTTVLSSPLGPLRLVACAEGLSSMEFSSEGVAAAAPPAARDAAAEADSGVPGAVLVREAAQQLGEYFAGVRRCFDLPLAPAGTEFQKRVWLALREIPFGSTLSYGELAVRVGNRNASRAVGAANGKNPIGIIVPCHRVIGTSGALTGFGGGMAAKRWLLDHEARVAGSRLL